MTEMQSMIVSYLSGRERRKLICGQGYDLEGADTVVYHDVDGSEKRYTANMYLDIVDQDENKVVAVSNMPRNFNDLKDWDEPIEWK